MCLKKNDRPVFATPSVFVHNPYAVTPCAAIAGPPETEPTCRPICLDYLRGDCGKHRESCTYAHPELHVLTERTNMIVDGKKVCPVWALTGFCKFGPRCRQYHPHLEGAVPGAPPITHRMTRSSKVRARKLERARNEKAKETGTGSTSKNTSPSAVTVQNNCASGSTGFTGGYSSSTENLQRLRPISVSACASSISS
eukprot:TRINITY_DN62216_c0_g1_i2.p1 TRINITY_DN62216_c0_g1~~TRINITY_DN62216_c0_g1_i2.p1  ORF type:complete len:197 (-),score=23.77 TRINITY_DN62216_c0_g1_i2:740-1330(-)